MKLYQLLTSYANQPNNQTTENELLNELYTLFVRNYKDTFVEKARQQGFWEYDAYAYVNWTHDQALRGIREINIKDSPCEVGLRRNEQGKKLGDIEIGPDQYIVTFVNQLRHSGVVTWFADQLSVERLYQMLESLSEKINKKIIQQSSRKVKVKDHTLRFKLEALMKLVEVVGVAKDITVLSRNEDPYFSGLKEMTDSYIQLREDLFSSNKNIHNNIKNSKIKNAVNTVSNEIVNESRDLLLHYYSYFDCPDKSEMLINKSNALQEKSTGILNDAMKKVTKHATPYFLRWCSKALLDIADFWSKTLKPLAKCIREYVDSPYGLFRKRETHVQQQFATYSTIAQANVAKLGSGIMTRKFDTA